MDYALPGVLVAGVVGPLLGYLAASHKLSGKIDSSEASSLWEESARMRAALREQNETLQARIVKLEERAASQESANNALQARNIALDRQALDYQRTIDEQRREIDTLKQQVHDLQDLVKTLQEGAA